MERRKPRLPHLLGLFLLVVACCYGDDHTANHLLMFDAPPDGVSLHKAVPFDIRSNFSGNVQLVESRDFRIVVNVTATTLRKAYDVTAELAPLDGGMLLEIKEDTGADAYPSLLWILIGLIIAAIIVGIVTAVYAIRWYGEEREKIDMSDRKSYASSSQRGAIYRSRNSMQLVALPPGGDQGFRMDDTEMVRNVRGEEELRQVQELPEEEEAEALEMEQLRKLKLKESLMDSPDENQDCDPQERNLIKSRFNSQPKTIHKEMLKKPASFRRVQNGSYECVPTSDFDDFDMNLPSPKKKSLGSCEKLWTIESQRIRLDDIAKSTGSLSTFGKTPSVTTELDYSNDPSNTDPMLLVLADVHKNSDVVSINRDKPSRAGNMYVKPSELRPGAAMSTFGRRLPEDSSSRDVRSPLTADSPYTVSSGHIQPPPSHVDMRSRKYPVDDGWYPPGIPIMGDIPEDPREDEQSVISGSNKSASMYGSSEIFDACDDSNTYYNVDSDLDIPPLDSDDILSDGGLQSPLGFSLPRSKGQVKTNDDIRLIPGALKSPGPNTGKSASTPKHRPNSSFIPRTAGTHGEPDMKPDNRPSAKKGGAALHPPTYEEVSQQGSSGNVFQFPPPPQMHPQPPSYYKAWARGRDPDEERRKAAAGSGDYVQIKPGSEDRKKWEEAEPRRPGGGARGGGGAKTGATYMNLTLLCTVCALALVQSTLTLNNRKQDTRVDIIVFAPRHYLTNSTRIFLNENKDTEIFRNPDGIGVLVYDLPDPLISKQKRSLGFCSMIQCNQGCDDYHAKCVCFKGYRMNEREQCVDVNECMEGKARCHSAAGCYNRKGTYDCICGEDYYGDGKSCRECDQPCPENHFEVQPCSADKQKICKACTQTCRKGYYMVHQCSSHANAICRVCQPECQPNEYETRRCTNFHDRECRSVSTLPPPQVSGNVMLEERAMVQSPSVTIERLPPHYVGFSRHKLFRGTGFYVEATVRFMDAAQHFLPVNVTQPYVLKQAAPESLSAFSVQRYCPSPMPDYYTLSYKKKTDMTYRVQANGSIEPCDTGKTMSTLPQARPAPKTSLLCSQPGGLTNRFDVNEDFFNARTKWVDKSKRCQRRLGGLCEKCTRNCGMDTIKGGQSCSTNGSDEDNGHSPRLEVCYNCCVMKKCIQECENYHRLRCRAPEQCLKGNLMEFTLEPSWDSSQDGRFFCHITPAKRQKLLEVEYAIKLQGKSSPLYSTGRTLFGNRQWLEEGAMDYSDGLLSFVVNSSLGRLPNFLEGGITMESSIFKVGSYKSEGAEFGKTRVGPDTVFVRPAQPVGAPSMQQAHQECTNNNLDDMLLASNMENPYILSSNLEATANQTPPFIVTNKRREPTVTIKMEKTVSLLQSLFTNASLKDDSLKAGLKHNGSHWIMGVQGELATCPGYLRLLVVEPRSSSTVLFDCDIAVLCPKTFDLTFAIPTFDRKGVLKDLMVVVEDRIGTTYFRVYHQSEAPVKKEKEEEPMIDYSAPEYPSRNKPRPTPDPEMDTTPDLPIRLPYLLAVCGAIIFLLVLAIIGLCFQPGIPDTPFARWYHPLLAISYMVFHFIYSVVISGSVFILILITFTSVQLAFVLQHGQHSGVNLASNQVELLQLQRHIEKEIARQDGIAEVSLDRCLRDTQTIVADMKLLHQRVLNATDDIFQKHRLELLLEQQKIHVRQKLSKELEAFRENYFKAARSMFQRINQDALSSFQNVRDNNTWLEGARFLHGMVSLMRRNQRKDQRPFLQWAGMDTDYNRLEIDLKFSLPPLPRLDDLKGPPPPKPTVKGVFDDVVEDSIRSVQVHNNWFFPLKEANDDSAFWFQMYSSNNNNIKEEGQRAVEVGNIFYLFLGLLLSCDVILLCHRMCKAWTVAKLILFGFPEYFRGRKQEEEEVEDDDVFGAKESKDTRESRNKLTPVHGCRDSPLLGSIRMFFTQTISTTFFPKIVGAIAACMILICLLQVSNRILTVDGLKEIGLYHDAEKYVDLQTAMSNGRLSAHALYINTLAYPAFQATVQGHLQRHRSVYGLYREQMFGLQNLTAQMYCQHLRAIGVDQDCASDRWTRVDGDNGQDDKASSVIHTCRFVPVLPETFTRVKIGKSPSSELQVETVLESIRTIIFHASRIIIIFLAVIVIKELASAVLWIFIQRSGVIRLRIIVEQDQEETAR